MSMLNNYFTLKSELFYNEKDSFFYLENSNCTLNDYYISSFLYIKCQSDTNLNKKYYEIDFDTLLIDITKMDTVTRVNQEEYGMRMDQYSIIFVPISKRQIKPLSSRTEIFRIKELKGLSFNEIKEKIKMVKIKYFLRINKEKKSNIITKCYEIKNFNKD